MAERLPATLSVALGGAFLYLLFGVPIGVAAARRRGTVADKALVSSFLTLSSIPYYLFALLAWLFLTVIFEIPFFSTPATTRSRRTRATWFTRHVPAPGWRSASSAARSTPATPGRDGRDPERGLHPDREGQGPAGADGGLPSTACGPPSCRS